MRGGRAHERVVIASRVFLGVTKGSRKGSRCDARVCWSLLPAVAFSKPTGRVADWLRRRDQIGSNGGYSTGLLTTVLPTSCDLPVLHHDQTPTTATSSESVFTTALSKPLSIAVCRTQYALPSPMRHNQILRPR